MTICHLHFYFAISIKIFPTASPPKVPIRYPIIAIKTPTLTRDLLYAAAKIGADATPPMFESEATAIENKSSLNILAPISIIKAWMSKTLKPARTYTPTSLKESNTALEPIRAIMI